MLKITSNMLMESRKETVLNKEQEEKAAQGAFEAIKKELPAEALTTEVLEYVISEMEQKLKEKAIIL